MNRTSAPRLGNGQPRYALLAEAIIGEIESGRYPVGSLLPTEVDLASQFGLSRHTVREAMRRLGELGMVSRQQGVGTRVKASCAPERGGDSVASITDLFQFLRSSRIRLLRRSEVTADASNAELLRCKPGQRWIRLDVLRYEGKAAEPMVSAAIYLNPAFSGAADAVDGSVQPVWSLIEERYGERVIEVQQDIRPVALGRREARELGVKPGALALHIVRHYLGAGDRLLEVSASTYPAERFSYAIRMRFERGTTHD